MKWEYLVITIHHLSLSTTLDTKGGEGWELVFCMLESGSYKCIFKRPLK